MKRIVFILFIGIAGLLQAAEQRSSWKNCFRCFRSPVRVQPVPSMPPVVMNGLPLHAQIQEPAAQQPVAIHAAAAAALPDEQIAHYLYPGDGPGATGARRLWSLSSEETKRKIWQARMNVDNQNKIREQEDRIRQFQQLQAQLGVVTADVNNLMNQIIQTGTIIADMERQAHVEQQQSPVAAATVAAYADSAFSSPHVMATVTNSPIAGSPLSARHIAYRLNPAAAAAGAGDASPQVGGRSLRDQILRNPRLTITGNQEVHLTIHNFSVPTMSGHTLLHTINSHVQDEEDQNFNALTQQAAAVNAAIAARNVSAGPGPSIISPAPEQRAAAVPVSFAAEGAGAGSPNVRTEGKRKKVIVVEGT